jgi:predicted Rossmann-fold nucleotide-binding protein
VLCADALVAVGGEFGTLSEIALALRSGKPAVGLDTWELRRQGRVVDAIVPATSPEQAVDLAIALAAAARDNTV